MKRIHVPQVNVRYWLAITFASLLGTNLGDFYAHASGFSTQAGVGVLAAFAALVFFLERRGLCCLNWRHGKLRAGVV